MIRLPLSLLACNSDAFKAVIKQELCSIDAELLPLQKGLRYSSMANPDSLSISVLTIEDDTQQILVKAGLFYTGIIAGCNCADDPTPVDENNEYCEVFFRIDKHTAETTVTLID